MRVHLADVEQAPLWLGSTLGRAQDLYRGNYPARMAGCRHSDSIEGAVHGADGRLQPQGLFNVVSPDHLAGEDRAFTFYRLGSPTIVRFSNSIHPVTPELIAGINSAGGNCWLDADDDWGMLPRGLEWYRWCRQPEDPYWSMIAARDRIAVYATWFEDAARAAKGIVCSTPLLASALSRLNPRAVIVPNVIDPAFVPDVPRRSNVPLVIGVSCSGFHAHDLELLIPALQACNQVPNTEVVLFAWHPGLQTDQARQQQEPGRYHNWGFTYTYIADMDFAQYCHALGVVDIGVVPLHDTPHTRIKSNCKYLEFSRHGTAGVYARLPPYDCIVDGETGLLAYTPDEYTQQLLRLVHDADLRARIGAAARTDVMSHHTLEARAPDVLAAVAAMREESR